MGLRRSYLRQIAEPVADGMVALFPLAPAPAAQPWPDAITVGAVTLDPAGATPRAASRRTAVDVPRVTKGPVAQESVARGEVLRRSASRAAPSASTVPPAPVAAGLPCPAGPQRAATNLAGPAFVGAEPAATPEPLAATEANREPRRETRAAGGSGSSSALPLAWGEPVAFAAPHAAAAIAAAKIDPSTTAGPGPAAVEFVPPELPHALPRYSGPTIHIGHIEVRSAPPAQNPLAPNPAVQPPLSRAAPTPVPPAPMSRGYGWRFGLSQG